MLQDFGHRRQSAVENCQSGTVRAHLSQSYGGEQFALNFAQDLNTGLRCTNVVPMHFFLIRSRDVITAAGWKKKPSSLLQMHDKDREGETKSICSCVFLYAACRSYLGSDRLWAFLVDGGKGWVCVVRLCKQAYRWIWGCTVGKQPLFTPFPAPGPKCPVHIRAEEGGKGSEVW